MSLTSQAIEKNRITAVLLALIFVSGLMAYGNMPRNEDPGFIIRTAQVLTIFPGASPERVELLVTDKIEEAVKEIPQLDFVNSTSRTGVSEVFVNIQEKEMVMRPIWDDMRRKVNRASSELPAGVIGPIVNDEFGDVFGIVFTITGEGYSYAELKEVADQVRSELLRIPDAAKVEIHGEQEERVFVEYTNAGLAEVGLSAVQLKNILAAQNILLPGGSISTGDERISLEPTGNFESIEELRATVIAIPGSRSLVTLGDIANVYRGYVDPPSQMIRSNRVRALALGVSLKAGGNLIDLGDAVKAKIRSLERRYPIGIEFEFVTFQPAIVEKKVSDFAGNLVQAVVIVMIVMLVSLGFRTGLIVSSLIPMTMVMSILVMSILDIGIDQMSLAALIIALGLLVDNSIVVSESILVGMSAGKSVKDSAVDTAAELKIPLLTSSLTTAAAFLPIYLAESSTGEYTAPLFKVVTITLLCSWLISLTMIPLLAVMFMKVKSGATTQSFDTSAYRIYRNIILTALRNRAVSVVLVIAVFYAAMFGLGYVPSIFFPPKDVPMFYAELEMPIGTPIEKTDDVVEDVEAFVASELKVTDEGDEGVTSWASFVGQGPPKYTLTYNPKAPSPEYAMMLFNTTSYEVIVDELLVKLEDYITRDHPDVKPVVRSMLNGPPVNDPIEIRISGETEDDVFRIVDTVKERLAGIPGTKNISDNWGARTKKLVVKIDQARARRAGLSSQDVAVSLQTVLSGFETTQFREGDEIIPVTLRSVSADREDVGKLESLNIFSQVSGQSVPLKQVADIEVVWQPSKILRRDGLKSVTVSAAIDPGITAMDVFGEMDTWLTARQQAWPVGYNWEFGGEYEASVEANASVGAKVPIAAMFIVLLLVVQFNSLRRPLIILLTIPLGMIGVTIGLLVADSYMGFMTFLGVISLAGIVINNAIVLLDRIQIEIKENGLDEQNAIVAALQTRLRPILLTTCTTIGGMLPLWYGGGPMFEPMAIAIIFGLLFATALTLGVVPVLYSIFFRVSFKDYTY